MEPLRPAEFCREMLEALEASEGRRRKRKRNTTPDAIGLSMKRALLEQALAADPQPDEFERWLFERCIEAGPGNGGLHAVALSILEEWRFTADLDGFRAWLAAGAPSDDRRGWPHHQLMTVLAIVCCTTWAACSMNEEERQSMLQQAERTNYEIGRGAVVRDMRSPSDTGRLIYTPPVQLSEQKARDSGAVQLWAPFGIATPDSAPAGRDATN